MHLGAATLLRVSAEGLGTALVLVVQARTGQAAQAGFLQTAMMLPYVLSGPIAGHALDRTPRPRSLVLALAACYVLAAGLLLVAAGRVPLPLVLLVAVVVGCTEPVVVALTGLLPRFVPPALLTRAYGLEAATYNVAAIAGPGLAAVLAAALGAGYAGAAVVGSAALGLTLLPLLAVPPPVRSLGPADPDPAAPPPADPDAARSAAGSPSVDVEAARSDVAGSPLADADGAGSAAGSLPMDADAARSETGSPSVDVEAARSDVAGSPPTDPDAACSETGSPLADADAARSDVAGTASVGPGAGRSGAAGSSPADAGAGAPSAGEVGRSGGSVLDVITGGLVVLVANRVLRAVTVATTLAFLGMGGIAVTAVLFAGHIGERASAGGQLIAAFAVGSLAGSLAAARWLSARWAEWVLVSGMVAFGVALGAIVLAPGLLWAVAGFVVAGICDGPVFAATLTVRQREAPADRLGQVNTTGGSLKIGSAALGAGLTGALAGHVGAVGLLLGMAALQLLGAALGAVLLTARKGS